MRKGRLKRMRLVRDTNLNLEKLSEKKGVYHLTLQNNGSTTAILDDATQQDIAPGEMFVVESPIAIINNQFPIIFKEEKGKLNSLIVSYIVPLDDCKIN